MELVRISKDKKDQGLVGMSKDQNGVSKDGVLNLISGWGW